MKHFSILLIGLVLISGFGATQGCTETFEKVFDRKDKPKIENKVFNEELEKNRLLWQKKNIADYKITMDIDVGVLRYRQPILIKVENKNNVSVEPVNKKDISNPEYQRNLERYAMFETIEKMFNTIQESLNKENETKEKVIVKYNDEFGYPEEILVMKPGTTHSHFFVIIKKFEIIKDLSRS